MSAPRRVARVPRPDQPGREDHFDLEPRTVRVRLVHAEKDDPAAVERVVQLLAKLILDRRPPPR